MKYTPKDAIDDLINYLNTRGFTLSYQAKEIFLQAENINYKLNADVYYPSYLAAIIKQIKPFQALIIENGDDPNELFEICLSGIKPENTIEDYDTYYPPYSSVDRNGPRESMIDFSLVAAQRNKRNEIRELDVLEALLNAQDEFLPPLDNVMWKPESELRVPYNTLSHIHGQYSKKLWIKFDDIRRELSLGGLESTRKSPLDAAPSRLKTSVLSFLYDNPDYHKNCFLIMPFSSTPTHQEIHNQLRSIMRAIGFNLLRADDKQYTDDVLSNIETYIYGCRFAVAVHERVLQDEHNANVALEIGYFIGLKKPVCLLKEKTVKALPSDLQGRLYVEFDGFNIKESLEISLEKWLRDKRLI